MANKTLELIKSRVSCRSYSDKKVSLKKALEIAEAGKYAPSGMNRQIANIFLVHTKGKVEKLRKLGLENCNRDVMYGAKTILLVGAPRDDRFTEQDCSCILENLFLAAHALKINTCWINQFDELFQTKDGLKVKKSLGIPEDFRIVGSCILGYAKDPDSLKVKPRKDDFIKVV